VPSGDGEVCLDAGKRGSFGVSLLSAAAFDHLLLAAKAIPLPEPVRSAILASKPPGIWRMSVDIDEVNSRFVEPVAPVTVIGADIETGRVTP
jgi:hypothetical protein